LQVLKEALRLYPPSSAIVRVAVRDTVLGERYPIRKNTAVTFSQYVLHRRPDAFPDPERFDPERFLPQNEQRLPRYAYLPFGAGHRVCIGNHFAMMEGQLLLATIAQRLRFELATRLPMRPTLPLTLRPIRPVMVAVTRRRAPAG
jgi:cytochrome P450